MGFFDRNRPREDDGLSRAYLAAAPPGSRADNLATSVVQQATELDLCAASRFGEPLTVSALEPASVIVRRTLEQDRDLSAWIARKSAVILNAVIGGAMNGGAGENLARAFGAAGLDFERGMEVRQNGRTLPDVEREGAKGLGVACLALLRVVSSAPDQWEPDDRAFYENLYTGRDGSDVEDLAYDLTAWNAVVTGRLSQSGLIRPGLPIHDPAFRRVPRLTAAGWYPNPPKFGDTSSGDAQIQRYWDGARWTDRVRLRQGREWAEMRHSLHDTPVD